MFYNHIDARFFCQIDHNWDVIRVSNLKAHPRELIETFEIVESILWKGNNKKANVLSDFNNVLNNKLYAIYVTGKINQYNK